MGSAIGALLHEAGNTVTLIDVSRPAIDAVTSRGLIIQDKVGNKRTVRVQITDQPATIGVVDLLIVFVKCYQTADAVGSALTVIGPHTTVLSLQNGWGNGRGSLNWSALNAWCWGLLSQRHRPCPGHVLHAGQGKPSSANWMARRPRPSRS